MRITVRPPTLADLPACLSEIFPGITAPLAHVFDDVFWSHEGEVSDSLFIHCGLVLELYGEDLVVWMRGDDIGSSAFSPMLLDEIIAITSIEALDTWVYTHMWLGKDGLRENLLRHIGGDL